MTRPHRPRPSLGNISLLILDRVLRTLPDGRPGITAHDIALATRFVSSTYARRALAVLIAAGDAATTPHNGRTPGRFWRIPPPAHGDD